MLHSSAEASTSAFPYGAEGDEVDIIGTTSVKKKSRSPVWHFFKLTDQKSKSGIVLGEVQSMCPSQGSYFNRC